MYGYMVIYLHILKMVGVSWFCLYLFQVMIHVQPTRHINQRRSVRRLICEFQYVEGIIVESATLRNKALTRMKPDSFPRKHMKT